ncbi:transmembrane protein 14C [Agrilus planipennis]|uniref:Transmembrane protein 14C n=1 Tax=Agrilus planipennis TaxID=224129 RepID=A0A1W4WXH1_AGRPL|nr:transmembrane protein 14C [Agrilus planipennis]
MTIDLPGFAYAAAIAAGGVLGYYRKKSIPSLGAGLICGTVLAYGAWQASQEPPSYLLQICATSSLTALMGYRFYNTRKIMPAGGVCLLSVAMIFHIALRASGLTAKKINT